MRTFIRRVLWLVIAVGAGVGVYYARRDLNPPIDRSGAGVPLGRPRAPLGATSDAHVVHRPNEPEWARDLARWTPTAPRTSLGRLAAYIWASPATLGGLIAGLLTGTAPQVRDGVLVFTGAGGLTGAILKRQGFAATTLGHVVIARRANPSAALMAHELAHTRQAERLGPLMGPVYWSLLARFGYARHPLERAARIAGRRERLHGEPERQRRSGPA